MGRRGLARDGLPHCGSCGRGVPPGPVSHRRNTRSAIVELCTVPIAAAVALYLLPLLIGCACRAPDLAAVAVVNIAFGWTFAGWIVDLAMTFRTALPPPLVSASQPTPPVTAARPVPGWLGPGGPPRRPPGTALPRVLPPRPRPREGMHGT